MIDQTALASLGTRMAIRSGATREALRLYDIAHSTWLKHLVAKLIGRRIRLIDLTEHMAAHVVDGVHHGGIQQVPLKQIRGSETRRKDFDVDFAPLNKHNEKRWVGIAAARLRDVPLPPVQLIQAGDIYFVRDGHHRISVARAMGQQVIDAVVTVWEVANLLPADRTAR